MGVDEAGVVARNGKGEAPANKPRVASGAFVDRQARRIAVDEI
jgi:hypothetical protein